MSHVVGHGQGSTSGLVPLGPLRARGGSSATRMDPYLSRAPIRVHLVFRQGQSGPVGTYRPHRPKIGQVQKQSRINRLARNKDQMNRIACPDPSGPLLKPKTDKKSDCLRKTAPRGSRRPPSLLSAQAGAYVTESKRAVDQSCSRITSIGRLT